MYWVGKIIKISQKQYHTILNSEPLSYFRIPNSLIEGNLWDSVCVCVCVCERRGGRGNLEKKIESQILFISSVLHKQQEKRLFQNN